MEMLPIVTTIGILETPMMSSKMSPTAVNSAVRATPMLKSMMAATYSDTSLQYSDKYRQQGL